MDSVQAAGLLITYRRRGNGDPLVLLHGGVSDSREWRQQFHGLTDGFDVVAWDAPGCGDSEDPPASFRMPDYADCLAAFVEALGLGRPHVLGLSFGTSVALELCRRHPELPRSLVLASAYAGWAGSLPPDVVAERLAGCLRDAELPKKDLIANWLPGLLTDGATEEMTTEVSTLMSDSRPAGFLPMAHAMAESDLRDVLPEIDVPTLLLYGELDKRSPLHIADELHAAITGSSLAVIPGVGHMCNVEAPDRFNDEVRRFLTAL